MFTFFHGMRWALTQIFRTCVPPHGARAEKVNIRFHMKTHMKTHNMLEFSRYGREKGDKMPYMNVMMAATDRDDLKCIAEQEGMSAARLASILLAQGVERLRREQTVVLRERLDRFRTESAAMTEVKLPQPSLEPSGEPDEFSEDDVPVLTDDQLFPLDGSKPVDTLD